MNDSDHISIAHSKIDKFESILLINHVFKQKKTQNLSICFFGIKTAILVANRGSNQRQREPEGRRPKGELAVERALARLVGECESRRRESLGVLAEFAEQTRKVNRAKLEKVVEDLSGRSAK